MPLKFKSVKACEATLAIGFASYLYSGAADLDVPQPTSDSDE